jgi:hypothetical protein
MFNKIIIIAFLSGFGFGYSNAQNTYHFSSSAGNDLNDGSLGSPFQTITKLNGLALSGGDKIVFKRGDTFIGQLIVSHSGTNGAPIVYDSYSSGALPILSGSNGSNGTADPLSTIDILDKEYLEFHNLHIENERFDAAPNTDDDKSFGILIHSNKTLPDSQNFEEETLSKYFRFSNLHFENIYSLGIDGLEFNKVRTTGIYFDDAFANDVIVEECYFTDIQRTGVWLKKYVSDAIIRNNKFIDLGGSGTIISTSKRVLYEHNIMRFSGSDSDSRMAKRGSGMWVFNTDDMVAQYNLSQHARGDGDSSGMHVDFGNSNILFQYNYSEDSAGGFCETLGDNDNVIWRYNVSVNDGTTDKGGKNTLLWVSDYAGSSRRIKSNNVYIYNNTIYQGKDYKNVIGNSKVLFQVKSLNFLNNIIYLESDAKLGELEYTNDITTPFFSKNIMYGGVIKNDFKNLDAKKIEQDPKFLVPGTRHFSGYKLKIESPALGSALSFTEPTFPLAGVGIFKDITSKATKDIYGNPVDLSSSTNIGAYNGPGETYIPIANTYEAESGIIVGGNIINSCSNGSNGKAVNIGNEGETLTINNINVPSTDNYLIKIFYANPFKSNLKFTLNSGGTETIILPYSDGYCYQGGNPTSFDFMKTLKSGNNTIKLEQGFIDKIEVISMNDATLSSISEEFLDKTEAYLEKTVIAPSESIKLIINKELESKKVEVSIYNINGALLRKENFNSKNINIEAHSLGTGLKIFTAKIEGYLFVKKIIIK